MNTEKKDNLLAELVSGEMDLGRLDGVSSIIVERYELNNSVALHLIIYSNLIAFGFREHEEAMELANKLISNYSSYELKELAITLLGEEVVEYYKELIILDYKILSSPLAAMLETMDRDLGKVMEEFKEGIDKVGELIPEDSQ